jgi:2-keto-4-pentenoate hydratase/2-oxohepta-3-ene-1,7-dioic acid hydratase in catechol pathway
MALEPGDLFSTGTPGAAPVDPGDEVRAVVESIGTADAPVTW